METTYFRDSQGWNGKTTIDLENGRQLVIRTSKRAFGGGLATNATVWHIAGDGVRRHAMGFGLGNGDYSERLVLSQHARITEKVVRAQHEATLARITSIRDDVRDYYAAQERRAQAQHEQENQPHAIGA